MIFHLPQRTFKLTEIDIIVRTCFCSVTSRKIDYTSTTDDEDSPDPPRNCMGEWGILRQTFFFHDISTKKKDI